MQIPPYICAVISEEILTVPNSTNQSKGGGHKREVERNQTGKRKIKNEKRGRKHDFKT